MIDDYRVTNEEMQKKIKTSSRDLLHKDQVIQELAKTVEQHNTECSPQTADIDNLRSAEAQPGTEALKS